MQDAPTKLQNNCLVHRGLKNSQNKESKCKFRAQGNMGRLQVYQKGHGEGVSLRAFFARFPVHPKTLESTKAGILLFLAAVRQVVQRSAM